MKHRPPITKTYLCNLHPLKPHFYIVKLGFTGVYIIFLISAQKIDCGYSLEQPHRGGSNEYPQSMFWAEVWKNIRFLVWIFFHFWVVKFSIYLNRRVFVMWGILRSRDRERIRTTQTPHMKPQMHKQGRTATEGLLWKLLGRCVCVCVWGGGGGGGGGLKQFYNTYHKIWKGAFYDQLIYRKLTNI